jgi:phosphatidate cytidylyltransferase
MAGSAIATMLGQMGDLAESAFKRRYGVKDSSHIIPGHGGFMDRLDAYWSVVALAGLVLIVVRL